MPIRINLLAEAQAAEELRRKDPVKRATLAALVVVILVAAWAAKLQVSIISSGKSLSSLEVEWKAIDPQYQQVVQRQRELIEAEQKLSALHQLTTNRFLWGTALNALQQSVGKIDDIQVIHFKTEQSYLSAEDLKARGDTSAGAAGATATEKISLTIEGLDFANPPGSQITRFKEAIAGVPFFQDNLQKTNAVLLTSLSAPQPLPSGKGSFVRFTLQCSFPEKVR